VFSSPGYLDQLSRLSSGGGAAAYLVPTFFSCRADSFSPAAAWSTLSEVVKAGCAGWLRLS
jgi:hypothetical protein